MSLVSETLNEVKSKSIVAQTAAELAGGEPEASESWLERFGKAAVAGVGEAGLNVYKGVGNVVGMVAPKAGEGIRRFAERLDESTGTTERLKRAGSATQLGAFAGRIVPMAIPGMAGAKAAPFVAAAGSYASKAHEGVGKAAKEAAVEGALWALPEAARHGLEKSGRIMSQEVAKKFEAGRRVSFKEPGKQLPSEGPRGLLDRPKVVTPYDPMKPQAGEGYRAYESKPAVETGPGMLTPEDVLRIKGERAAKRAAAEPPKSDLPHSKRLGLVEFEPGSFAERQLPYERSVFRENNPMAAVDTRLRSMGKSGSKIADALKWADDVAQGNIGKVQDALVRAGVKKLSPERSLAIFDALEGRVDPKSLSFADRSIHRILDLHRNAVRERAAKYGVIDLGASSEGYFPHSIPMLSSLKRGKVREDVLNNALRLGRFNDRAEAENALNSFVELMEKGEAAENKSFLHWGHSNKLFKTPEEGLQLFSRDNIINRHGNLEFRRLMNHPFYDPMLSRSYMNYISGTERRLAEAQLFGPDWEKLTELGAGIKDKRSFETAEALIKGVRGDVSGETRGMKKWLGVGRQAATPMLNFITAAKQTGTISNIVGKASVPDAVRGLFASYTSAGQSLARRSGATAEATLRETAESVGGHPWETKYLKATGVLPVDTHMRVVAANTGKLYAERLSRNLLKKPTDSYLRSELQSLHVNPDAVLKAGGLSETEALRAAKVFSDVTQMRSRRIDLPEVYNSEWGKAWMKFRAFTMQQGGFVAKEVLDEFRRGHTKQALIKGGKMGASMLAMGELMNTAIGLATGKDPEQMYQRGDHPVLARVANDVMTGGGIGILFDALQSTSYKPEEWMLGPVFSRATRAGSLGSRAIERAMGGEEALSDSDKRYLVRSLPGIGPFLAYRIFPLED